MPKIKLNKRYRLKGFDYGSNATYFVTIACQNKHAYFGEIVNAEIQHSEIGKIVIQDWLDIPNHHPFVQIDEFVCMPDHFHGIIHFNKDQYHKNPNGNTFGRQAQNLATVVGTFKASITRYANKNNIPFQWQRLFHDSILRNPQELHNVRNYIKNNVKNWKKNSS
jgi:putative transposase